MYDFITCTETAEHFVAPRDDFLRLDGMLARGAWLGVMTETLDDWEPLCGLVLPPRPDACGVLQFTHVPMDRLLAGVGGRVSPRSGRLVQEMR